jgi:hypothetical protein
MTSLLNVLFEYIDWISAHGSTLELVGFIALPPLAMVVFWLMYGEKLMSLWGHLGPDTTTTRETLHGIAHTILSIPLVLARKVRWSDVPGIQARQWGKLMADRKWIVPMRSIEEDRRDETHRPPELEQDNSLMVVGQTGSGKTNTFKSLFEQQTFDDDTPVVVFDYKDDYSRFFSESQYDVIRVNPIEDNTNITWNVFEEIEDEDDIKEIAQGITEGLDIDVDVDFWSDAGSLLLEAIMKFLFRKSINETGKPPTNADLVKYLQSNEPEGIYQDLKQHTDLHMPAGSIDPEAKRLGLSVIATMGVDVQRMFFGAFARAGSFSIRDYVDNPDGRILVLDLPRKRQSTAKPVYQFLIDWAATHALADDHHSIFLLDEFASVPRLGMIDDLVNRGRSYNTQVMLGVQSLTQIEDTYGESKANTIMSGCTQQILMGTNDPQSAEYTQEKVGADIDEQTMADYDEDGDVAGSQLRPIERYPITRSDVDSFEIGECVIKQPNGDWVHGEIELFEDVSATIRSARQHAKDIQEDSGGL